MNHGFVINEFILFAGLNVSIDDKHATKERRIDYVNILKACSFLQQMLGKPVQVYLRRAEKIREPQPVFHPHLPLLWSFITCVNASLCSTPLRTKVSTTSSLPESWQRSPRLSEGPWCRRMYKCPERHNPSRATYVWPNETRRHYYTTHTLRVEMVKGRSHHGCICWRAASTKMLSILSMSFSTSGLHLDASTIKWRPMVFTTTTPSIFDVFQCSLVFYHT